MITDISNKLLRVDEEVGYYSEMLKLLESKNSDRLQLETFINKLKTAVNEAQKAIHQTRGSNHTDLANELEKIRDYSFMAFRDAIKAGTYRCTEHWAENAKKIERIIRSHGWTLYNEGTKVQTSLMESLKAELDKDENQKLIKEMALEGWYAEMNESNSKYLEVLKERFTEETQKEKFNNSEIYKSMRTAGSNIIKAINVLHMMSGNETYSEIANALNVITERFMVTARSRKTRNENEKAAVSENE